MKTLTVRQNAYNEVIEWLEGEEQGPKPLPPEGMHELAAAEWWAGHDEAYKEFTASESEWFKVEGVIAYVIKSVFLYGLLWLSHSTGNPYIQVLGGLAGLVFLWKFWR